jgi:hypothetical protein
VKKKSKEKQTDKGTENKGIKKEREQERNKTSQQRK